jgi:hypothetical protein
MHTYIARLGTIETLTCTTFLAYRCQRSIYGAFIKIFSIVYGLQHEPIVSSMMMI